MLWFRIRGATRLPGSTASRTKPIRLFPDASSRRQPDAAQALTGLDLHCHRHESLGFHLPAAAPGMHAADVRFIYLDATSQPIPSGTDHRAPQLVQPRPRRLVAAEPQFPLQAKAR
jgi:hypothetical protein